MNKKIAIKNNMVFIIILILYLANIYLKYFVPNILTKILPFTVFILLFSKVLYRNITIRKNQADIFFIIFAAIYLFGSLYGLGGKLGFSYAFSFIVGLAIQVLFRAYAVDCDFIIKISLIACLLLCASVIIQPIRPDIIQTIVAKLPRTQDELSMALSWARNSWYSGVFPDRAPAAFFASILIGCGLYLLFSNEGKIKLASYSFIAIGIYSILLTAKRGFLVGIIVATFITYIAYNKALKRSVLKTVCILSISALVIGVILLNLPAAQTIVERFTNSDDITTGRTDIYKMLWQGVKTHPFLGVGTGSTDNILGLGGHNIYLTVMYENGIGGTLLLVIALFSEIKSTIRHLYISLRSMDGFYANAYIFSLYVQLFFVVYGMYGNPLYDNYILFTYFLALVINSNAINKIYKGSSNNLEVLV